MRNTQYWLHLYLRYAYQNLFDHWLGELSKLYFQFKKHLIIKY